MVPLLVPLVAGEPASSLSNFLPPLAFAASFFLAALFFWCSDGIFHFFFVFFFCLFSAQIYDRFDSLVEVNQA